MLENKLGITNSLELEEAEERISKTKAKEMFDKGYLDCLEVGTYKGLSDIHFHLFKDIYDFAGKLRHVNIAKGNLQFAPLRFLGVSLDHIDKMTQHTFDEIIEKYVEMNIAHPFRDGNGRSTRIWLDLILKKELKMVVYWTLIKKEDYFSAMERSPINDIEIRNLIYHSLTDKIQDKDVFMKGIDVSYTYEGFTKYKTEDL
ncbi:protein adenylyltransferase Fic [Bacillus cereus]|uniref:protein adenylyltransferase Fic n=1 Tax=Bacillus cereus TaxID=1396 RepID=UPI003D16D437